MAVGTHSPLNRAGDTPTRHGSWHPFFGTRGIKRAQQTTTFFGTRGIKRAQQTTTLDNIRQHPTNNIGPWESGTRGGKCAQKQQQQQQQHKTTTNPQHRTHHAIVPSCHRAIVVRLIVESVQFYVKF